MTTEQPQDQLLADLNLQPGDVVKLRNKIAALLSEREGQYYHTIANAILAMIQPEPAGEWGSWIAWNGGTCPVADDTKVRGIEGKGPTSWVASAVDNDWQSFRGAYQVWLPAQEVTLYGEPGDIRWSVDRAIRANHTITGVIRPISEGGV